MPDLITKILYQKRRFLIGWSIGLFAVSLLMMLLFPALEHSQIGQLVSGLSPALQKVAGGSDTFSNVDSYISGELFALRLPLLLIVLSIILFAGLTVGDERRGILMTQLSLPYSRCTLLFQKLLAALLIMVTVSLAMVLGIIVGLLCIHDTADMASVLRQALGCLLVALDFGLIVFTLGGGLGWKAAATGIAAAVAFLSYLLSSLVAVASVLKPFERFSLFHYYQNPSPIDWQHIVLLGIIAGVLIIVGLVTFPRRDIDS